MNNTQFRSMMAAAIRPAPPHISTLRESLVAKGLASRPSAGRLRCLVVARSLCRHAEYYDARDSELVLLDTLGRREANGLSIEETAAKREAFWARVETWLHELGPVDVAHPATPSDDEAMLPPERVEAIRRGFSMEGWPVRDQYAWCIDAVQVLLDSPLNPLPPDEAAALETSLANIAEAGSMRGGGK